ncbi:MAG TPA: nitrilase-related carbon-nitrogen hydrolase [Candidatus Udaeobacter sp.]|nr:nitrilase-related carbon-nitrogen hydrolase [Candidatus Udaeobacter sp.]
MRVPNTLLVIAAGLASAAFFYLGTGLHPSWWALWLAPIPVLGIAPKLRGRFAFLLGAIAWFLGEMNQWNYVRHEMELPPPITILYFVVPAVIFGLGVLFVRIFIRRGSVFLASVALPVYWVTYEYLTAIASPHSTWGNLAYTQMNCLPVIQVAAIIGLWGISFIVFLFAGAAAALLTGAGGAWQRRGLAITAGFIICAVLVFGKWRLQSNSSESVAVTLIARDVPMSVYLGPEEQALELLREYADEVRRVTSAGTQAVVLPEKIGRVSESALAEVDALFSSAATDTRAAIVVGLVRRTASAAFNSSRLYSADGKLGANYDKHHLLPRVEPEKPGDKRVLLDEPSGRWGLQICKDMDFPQLSREYAADGANLLLVPAWDFNLDRWLHARMAVMRAVENGFAIARSARNGLLTLSDNRGRILAEAATVPGRFVSINGKVSVAREQTFYTRAGDWFAWVCVAVFVSLLAFQLFAQPRGRAKTA